MWMIPGPSSGDVLAMRAGGAGHLAALLGEEEILGGELRSAHEQRFPARRLIVAPADALAHQRRPDRQISVAVGA